MDGVHPADSHFGRLRPGELVDIGDRAVTKWGDDIRFCVSVVDSEVEARRDCLREELTDTHVIYDTRDEDGRRPLLFDHYYMIGAASARPSGS